MTLLYVVFTGVTPKTIENLQLFSLPQIIRLCTTQRRIIIIILRIIILCLISVKII